MTISNYLLGTSGEHRVCAELQQRRGCPPASLSGTRKALTWSCSVRTNSGNHRGENQPNRKFLTKYYQHEKPEGDRPDFWVFYNMG